MNQVTPIFKVGKRVDDPKYREYVRQLPCVICDGWGFAQCSPTEFHHTKSGRHSQAKTSCCFGIPLCNCHHRGQRFDRDRSKIAFHDAQDAWEDHYGPDTGFVAATLDRVEREWGYTPKGLQDE